MSSLFGRLKGSNAPGDSPTKKGDGQNVPSALEQLLADAGPLRHDGSDKFFGMHNCLYFSEPFRDQVISFPKRKPRSSSHGLNGTSQKIETSPPTTQPVKHASDGFFGFKRQSTNPTSPTTPASAPAENPATFDGMKKAAFTLGPHLRIEDGAFESYGMPESLFTGLKDIFEEVIAHSSRFGIVTPSKFLEVLRRNYEIFRSPMHQDAHEFLNLLLNEVVDQVESFTKNNGPLPKQGQLISQAHRTQPENAANTNISSWVHEIFEGTLTSETRCLTCENISQRDEVFLDLSVDLEEHSSVTSCLRKFSAEEMLCERNKFHCDKCSGLQEAEKRMKIKRLPRILALHLKRFKYYEEAGRLQKLFHRVVYPFHLRLFNTTDDAEDPDRLYELYGVIVHLGSTPFHGHYVSIIKTKDKGWLLFDDELVLPVDKNYVRNFFGGDPKNPACAYVLFYQETTVEAVEREQEAEDLAADTVDNGIDLKVDTSVVSSPVLASRDELLTPIVDDIDGFSKLEHAATAPQISPPLISPPITNGLTFDSSIAAQLDSTTSNHDISTDDRFANGRPAVLTKSTSFNRFRPTSMSLRQKPKFLGFKTSTDMREVRDEGESSPILSPEKPPAAESPVDKPEKSKRFNLGRKRSSMMPTS